MMIVVLEIGQELWDGAVTHFTVVAVSCAVLGLLAGVLLAGKAASERRSARAKAMIAARKSGGGNGE